MPAITITLDDQQVAAALRRLAAAGADLRAPVRFGRARMDSPIQSACHQTARRA